METKKVQCFTTFGVVFTLILVVSLPVTTFFIFDSNDVWEFKDKLILQIFGEKPFDQRHQNHSGDINKFPSEMSPNLTSCHDSYGRPDLLVNCCPPPDGEAKAVAIDFEFPDPSKTPFRVRRPVHRLDSDYLAKYAKAVAAIKSLPNSDPRSFSRQANIHCTFCTGAFDIKGTSEGLNIHRQWLFFPFHRIYLYFHERILAKFSGDDNFSLPFWPWDNPDNMYFPEMFHSDPFSDTQRDPTHFSPRLVDLNFDPDNATENFAVTKSDNLAFMYNQMVSAASRPELFMGCSLHPGEDGFCDGPGTVEHAPHNTVHSWVGSAANPGRENMGAFYTAAWDPSFYPHHANIDRLWDVWRDIHRLHVPFKDPVWLNSFFYFFDENAQLVRIKVADVLDLNKLRYSYENVDRLWLSSRPRPSVDPRVAKRALRRMKVGQGVSNGGQSLESPIRVRVERPRRYRTKREREEEEEVLVVYGIGVGEKVDKAIKFDVYVNLASEVKLGPKYREFVGTFTQLPKGGKKHRTSSTSHGSTLKLGISEALKDLKADRDESILVTLLPSSKSCANVTIGGIRIEFMK